MERSVLCKSAPRADDVGEGQGADEPSTGDETEPEPDTGRNCLIPLYQQGKFSNLQIAIIIFKV